MPPFIGHRHKLLRVAAVIAAVGLLVPSGQAGAQQDPRQQRDEVRKKKAAAAAEIDALQADDASVKQALADLQVNLNGLQAELDEARTAETQANESARLARAREEETEARIVTIRAELRDIAVWAYVNGATPAQLVEASTSTALDQLERAGYLQLQADRHVRLADDLRAAEQDLAIARQEAEASAAVAAQKRAEIEQRVGDVAAARQQQQSFAQQVETRLDQRLSEAASLASLDKELSNRIAAEEAAVAARVPRGGSGSAARTASNVPLRTVRGITVARSIADQVERMLAAAEADGLVFGGSGYRDSSSQEALRRQNCPDPENSPPSACRPPTARAGASMHEQGLAIDFTYGGHIINSHDDPGFRWLAANAGRYGFSNLPSEPWHWSVNGQ